MRLRAPWLRSRRVLLLDEPLSNLDAKLREQMRVELKGIHESLNITTVFVTHDQEEALALSDRIALMADGELVEVGTPTDLYLRPARRITADFLGSSNFVPGEVRENRAGDEIVIQSVVGIFSARRGAEWHDGSRASLFFRPEYVEFLSDAMTAGETRNQGSATVERTIFLRRLRRRDPEMRRCPVARADASFANAHRGRAREIQGRA